jgi:transcription initiation factor TFIIIB Brf1 subunit/transcription initiation factor TFIIB
MNGVSRTTHEIADAFDISTTDISRTINMLKQVTQTSQVSATFASDLLTRKLGAWELTGQKRMKIINLCKDIEKSHELIGKTPKCVACTVAYVMLEKVQKSDVCKVFEVSVPTVSKLEPIVREAISTKK